MSATERQERVEDGSAPVDDTSLADGSTALTTIATIGGFVAAIGLGLLIYFLVFATADVRGRVAEHNRIHGNATYRIATYNHFFDLCAGVQAREAAIQNAQQEAATATADRREQLAAVVTANRNERAELITTYNADASKTDTEANFLASNLPYHLDLNAKETQCAAP